MANQNGRKYGLTALFPIKAGEHCAELRTYLRSLDDTRIYPRGSPLCDVPIVHMARFVIIDRLAYQGFPARSDYLRRSYLLFMCDFDGEALEPLVWALIQNIGGVVETIWEHCEQFPGIGSRDGVIAYFEQCQLETNLFLADRPQDTVSDILTALMFKREFGRFVVMIQRKQPRPDLLRRGFRRMWRSLETGPMPDPGSL